MLAIAHTTPSDPAACRRLAAMGVTVFEIDVRLRGDRLVASHFLPLLPRLDVVQRRNRRLRINGPWVRDADLDASIERVPAGCRILLDCKDDVGDGARRTVAAIAAHVRDIPRTLVASKHWASLESLAAAGFETWASVATRRALAAALHGGGARSAVTVRHSLLDAAVVSRLRTVHPAVMAWTVSSIGRAEQLAALGVDGITSDHTDVLRLAAAPR